MKMILTFLFLFNFFCNAAANTALPLTNSLPETGLAGLETLCKPLSRSLSRSLSFSRSRSRSRSLSLSRSFSRSLSLSRSLSTLPGKFGGAGILFFFGVVAPVFCPVCVPSLRGNCTFLVSR